MRGTVLNRKEEQLSLIHISAVGIVEKIISFLFLVPSSLLSTVSALGAQNIGAGKHDRVDAILRYAIGIGLTFGDVYKRQIRRKDISSRSTGWSW